MPRIAFLQSAAPVFLLVNRLIGRLFSLYVIAHIRTFQISLSSARSSAYIDFRLIKLSPQSNDCGRKKEDINVCEQVCLVSFICLYITPNYIGCEPESGQTEQNSERNVRGVYRNFPRRSYLDDFHTGRHGTHGIAVYGGI